MREFIYVVPFYIFILFQQVLASPTTLTNHHDVVIIGAGASGLAAATRLIEHNQNDFVVLEATDHYGGRLNSSKFGGYELDMGAQWCTGEEGNPVYDKAWPLGLLEHSQLDWPEDLFKSIYTLNGSIAHLEQAQRAFRIFDSTHHNLEEDADNVKYKGLSLEAYVKTKMMEALKKEENKDIDPHIVRIIYDFVRKYINGYNAFDDWDVVSFVEEGDEYPGDQYLNWKSKTFASFLEILLKPNNSEHSAKDRIILNKEVTNINWEKRPLKITCSDADVFTANYVIVTVPLGVLQHRLDSLFTPQLPSNNLNAIKNLNMGCLDKIYLRYPNKWWEESMGKHGVSFTIDELTEKDSLLEQLSGTKEENQWLLYLTEMNTVENKPEIWELWIYGEGARHAETLSDQVVQAKVMELIRAFIKSVKIPDPVEIKRSKWCSSPFAYGAYSWIGLNTIQANTSNTQLGEPVIGSDGKPAILFGGEATNALHFGTVPGAMETGYREADRMHTILTTLSTESKSECSSDACTLH